MVRPLPTLSPINWNGLYITFLTFLKQAICPVGVSNREIWHRHNKYGNLKLFSLSSCATLNETFCDYITLHVT